MPRPRTTGKVGVVEDDERRLPAEFEEYLLDGLRRGGHHRPPGRRGAGERHQVDAGVLAKLRAQSVIAGRHDVHHAGGMSVFSAMTRPTSAAHHGVSGAGFSTTVFPAASAGPSLAKLIWCGKFHGVMAPTTPNGSRTTVRLVLMPSGEATPRSVVHAYFSAVSVAYARSSTGP